MLNDLHKQGFSLLEPLTAKQILEINNYLLSRPVFVDAHVPQTARHRGDDRVPRDDPRAVNSECICVHNDDVILAPHLLERHLSLIDIAASYLEIETPRSYSANCFWTRPGRGALRGDIQSFHKDADDTRFLAMFTFLTDVDSDAQHDLVGPDEVVRSIKGPAGTMFLADTSRMHRGRKPLFYERCLVWFRWGVSERPPANQWDGIQPIDASLLGDRYPQDPRLRESIKLLVR
jgi:hypothetical protein